MMPARSPRWLMSFADLCLLLVAFFVFLHAHHDPRAAVASVRDTFGGSRGEEGTGPLIAARLFDPGEAVLHPAAARRLALIGAHAASIHGRLGVVSHGTDAASARFDGWELAAARAAAVARAIASGGLGVDRIAIVVPPAIGATTRGQVLTVEPG